MPLATSGFTLKGDGTGNDLVFTYLGRDRKGFFLFGTDPNGEPANRHTATISDITLKNGDRKLQLNVYKAKTVTGVDAVVRKRGMSVLSMSYTISRFDELQGRKNNRAYIADAAASTNTFFKGVIEGTDAISG